ncbi:SPFH domain-containing protein [Patescibacteria group bacterium]|nr:SPFH domain-containing protein [Patescibacteria group bacterium]
MSVVEGLGETIKNKKVETQEDKIINQVVNEIKLENNIIPPLIHDPILWQKILGWIIFMGFFSLVIYAINNNIWEVIAFCALVIVYSAACLKNITPEEKGIGITLSTPEMRKDDKVYSGGVYWRWFPLQWFYLFPTEQTIINIPRQSVVTAEKIIPSTNEHNVERPAKVYTEANIDVDAVIYFFWPNTASDLCEAYRNAPSPYNLAKLFEFFKPYLSSKVRETIGQCSWLEVRMSTPNYRKIMYEAIASDKEGAFSKSRITKFNIENELVVLPKILEDAISKEQVAMFNKTAGVIDAELNKIKIKKAGEGTADAAQKLGVATADAREKLLAVMKKYPIQAVNIMYEEMAKGQASTIFFELPSGMKSMLNQGGDIPSELKEIWDVTPKAQRAHLVEEIMLPLSNKNKK